jgi:hypothetical protein
MAQCIVAQIPGRTAADFDAVIGEVAPGGLPKGVVTQIVGTSAEGLMIITLWDTDEAGKFVQSNVKPVLEKHGLKPNITALQVHKHYQRK